MCSPYLYPGTVTEVITYTGAGIIVALDATDLAAGWESQQGFTRTEIHRIGCGCGGCRNDGYFTDPRAVIAQPCRGRWTCAPPRRAASNIAETVHQFLIDSGRVSDVDTWAIDGGGDVDGSPQACPCGAVNNTTATRQQHLTVNHFVANTEPSSSPSVSDPTGVFQARRLRIIEPQFT